MTKLFTDFFINACKYGGFFVYLNFARRHARSKNSNKYLDFYSLIRIFAEIFGNHSATYSILTTTIRSIKSE